MGGRQRRPSVANGGKSYSDRPEYFVVNDLDYLRKQVLTSRNIRGGRLVDFVLGGLNYQIEHHLFPSMPRSSLRRSQVMIREFCVGRGVSYQESSVIGSYAEALRHLYESGHPCARVRHHLSGWRKFCCVCGVSGDTDAPQTQK